MNVYPLSSGWQVKERDPNLALADDFAAREGWLAATVPGTVHEALLAAGSIPDPFIGLNERAVQWVGERDWLYRCTFELPEGFLSVGMVALCCDGLDTFATLWLNGQPILTSDNMFVPHRLQVDHVLHAGRNDLRILFESALRRGKAREAEHGLSQVWNGDASRVYVRKAQYHYGWDWGPCLLTAGPNGAVRLESYVARVADLHCPIKVAPDLSHATLPVRVVVEAEPDMADLMLRLALHDPSGNLVASAMLPVQGDCAHHTFEVPTPTLWWPRGYGAQPLYRLVAALHQGEAEVDQRTLRLGVRRQCLLQEPLADAPGTTFRFEINNLPLFCGGANWIPADSFTPRIPPERYRDLLHLAAEGNLAMLRVWGGGIYEPDLFYDLCDELGILVWQDFMFACGLYPAHDAFQASVRAEAEAAVRRLRHHPSLVLWCGNNEDYLLAGSVGRYEPAWEGDLADSPFPARALYERLLLDVCAALDPMTPYWPGSPYLGQDANDGTVGDRHTWEIWHGRMAPYQEYPAYAGRFVSEFGMQSLPALTTIEGFAPPSERYPESRTLEHHNKAEGGPRRLAAYLTDNLRAHVDLEGAVYATQFIQAEALAAAVRGWRRRFAGPGRYEVAGALVWQFNDCWPVTSWAIVDHALRPKPAYYTLRRELAPLVVGLAPAPDGAALWAVNGTSAPVEAEIDLTVWSLDGVLHLSARRPVTLLPHQATALPDVSFPVAEGRVVAARLVVAGNTVSRATLWPEPFKYLALPDPGLEMSREGDMVRLRVARPAKGVWLSGPDGVAWSDNMLDLLPDDEQVVVTRGLGEGSVGVRWLR